MTNGEWFDKLPKDKQRSVMDELVRRFEKGDGSANALKRFHEWDKQKRDESKDGF